jgi:hypothetical protein
MYEDIRRPLHQSNFCTNRRTSSITKMVPPQPPWPKTTSHKETYNAHCHCGDLRWTFELSPPLWLDSASTETDNDASTEQEESQRVYSVTSCSCSFCARHGVLSVHPKAKTICLSSHDDNKRSAEASLNNGTDDSGADLSMMGGRVAYKTGCRLGEWWFCGRCGCVGGLNMGKESGVVDEDGDSRALVNVRRAVPGGRYMLTT